MTHSVWHGDNLDFLADASSQIFGGTGTTLRVCQRINRRCTIVEMSANYCAEISKEHGIRIERVHQ